MQYLWALIGQTLGVRKVPYVVQTNSAKVIERCILMTTDPGDLVLDPTCGSGTTAYVAEQWGRRWITIDTSRVALALARARIMGARYPYYILADSRDGQVKEAELSRRDPVADAHLRQRPPGFRVRARAPHHPAGHRQQRRDRRHLRGVPAGYGTGPRRVEPGLGGVLEEWEIPREANDDWSEEAQELHELAGGSCASPARRRSTRPSPPTPSTSTCTTSPTRTAARCGSPVPSPWRASRPTGCWAWTRTATCSTASPNRATGTEPATTSAPSSWTTCDGRASSRPTKRTGSPSRR